ncbi:phosphotransferase enzyme family protein [Streptomyces sp. NPDC059166]|uniref:phosphotransferase enzyme family protein n=1 Tax=Streptomyces sp. NPDC059166 TaxID=3346752 RepID=UPI00369CAB56
MQDPDRSRAAAAAVAAATSLGLPVKDTTVLQDSNKLTLRLLPCDVLARVAPESDHVAHFEVDVARRLARTGAPVALPDPRVGPRVLERDGFVVTLWTYYDSMTPRQLPSADYARALGRLHTGMRTLDVPVPHFSDRVERARRLLADRDRTPALTGPDRRLLDEVLLGASRLVAERGGAEQLLHGEPHPGNVLDTEHGPLFIDFETCCRGPVEFDIAHTPADVGEHCPEADPDVLRACRALVLAMITTWRWDRDDRFPDGRRLGIRWLRRVRAEHERHGFGLPR